MDYCPAFWDMIDVNIENETVFVIEQVYQELTKGKSDVTDWIKDRKNDKFVKAFEDEEVQKEFIKIADYVQENYKQEVAADFLSGTDPWIVAICKVHEFTIVTKETFSEGIKKKVKIPNICKVFDVHYINDFEMIRELESKFVLE
jgi:hypothetical protein